MTLIRLIDTIRFLLMVLQAYRRSIKTGTNQYCALVDDSTSPSPIPHVTILIGTGRGAWRISQHAIETCLITKGE